MKKLKRGVRMCKKLKEIHGQQPEAIWKKYGHSHSNLSPVNAEQILTAMNIRVMAVDFDSLEESIYVVGNDAILGMAVSQGDDLIVLYKRGLEEITKNYVLAHELGHACLHMPVSSEFHVEMKTKADIYSPPVMRRGLFSKGKSLIVREREADVFSAKLLLPSSHIIGALKAEDMPTLSVLSEKFNVPREIVSLRISLGF